MNEHEVFPESCIQPSTTDVSSFASHERLLPGDNCPNKCGGVLVCLRHYIDAASKRAFAQGEEVVEKLQCDICATRFDWVICS